MHVTPEWCKSSTLAAPIGALLMSITALPALVNPGIDPCVRHSVDELIPEC